MGQPTSGRCGYPPIGGVGGQNAGAAVVCGLSPRAALITLEGGMRREGRQGARGRAVHAAGSLGEASFAHDEPGHSPASRLRSLLVRQALAVGRHRAALARRLGLSDTEMAALVFLEQAGALTPGELRARLSLSSGGTTALIQRLMRAGHVERRPNPVDRRSVVVSPTKATLAQLSGLTAPLVHALDDVATLHGAGARDHRRLARSHPRGNRNGSGRGGGRDRGRGSRGRSATCLERLVLSANGSAAPGVVQPVDPPMGGGVILRQTRKSMRH